MEKVLPSSYWNKARAEEVEKTKEEDEGAYTAK